MDTGAGPRGWGRLDARAGVAGRAVARARSPRGRARRDRHRPAESRPHRPRRMERAGRRQRHVSAARYLLHEDALAAARRRSERAHIGRCVLGVEDRLETVTDGQEIVSGVSVVERPAMTTVTSACSWGTRCDRRGRRSASRAARASGMDVRVRRGSPARNRDAASNPRRLRRQAHLHEPPGRGLAPMSSTPRKCCAFAGGPEGLAARRRQARPRARAPGRARPRRARCPRPRQRPLPLELLVHEGLRRRRLPTRGGPDVGRDGAATRGGATRRGRTTSARSGVMPRTIRARPGRASTDLAQARLPRAWLERIGLELSQGTQAADRMVGEPTFSRKVLRRIRRRRGASPLLAEARMIKTGRRSSGCARRTSSRRPRPSTSPRTSRRA